MLFSFRLKCSSCWVRMRYKFPSYHQPLASHVSDDVISYPNNVLNKGISVNHRTTYHKLCILKKADWVLCQRDSSNIIIQQLTALVKVNTHIFHLLLKLITSFRRPCGLWRGVVLLYCIPFTTLVIVTFERQEEIPSVNCPSHFVIAIVIVSANAKCKQLFWWAKQRNWF